MPAVISKFLESDQSRKLLNIPSSYVAGTLIATSLLYYVGYPLIEKSLKPTQTTKLTENNNSWHKNGCKKPLNGHTPINGHHVTKQPIPARHVSAKDKVIALAAKIPALNLEFINQFLRLLRIMIPSYVCRETVLLSGHTIFLLLRTFLSIYVANMEGAIVKYIVRKDARNFAKMLLKWFSVALPATFINSMIRYLESRIALSFR